MIEGDELISLWEWEKIEMKLVSFSVFNLWRRRRRRRGEEKTIHNNTISQIVVWVWTKTSKSHFFVQVLCIIANIDSDLKVTWYLMRKWFQIQAFIMNIQSFRREEICSSVFSSLSLSLQLMRVFMGKTFFVQQLLWAMIPITDFAKKSGLLWGKIKEVDMNIIDWWMLFYPLLDGIGSGHWWGHCWGHFCKSGRYLSEKKVFWVW